MDETAVEAAPAAPRSIGERLRAGRERAGLSVAAAAEKLHLDIKVIEALEADRFAELGASVYVRGHLRRYADFVGEPGAELVSSYTARESRPPPPDLTQIPQAERRADPRRLVTPLVGVACAVVLLVAIWWVLAGSHGKSTVPVGSPAAAQAAVPDHSVPTGVADGGVVPAGPAVQPALPTASAKPAPGGAVVASTTAAGAQPKRDASAEAAAAPAREMRLKLNLTNDSWVEVYDARGERLFYDVASAGSVQSVSGRGPLRVVLGNAAGVTVEVDGRARDIPENAVDGEGARFVVNRSGSLTRAR
jgi:cytoskeleton protein RodZ